jgi:hypothetical protein
MRVIIAGSPDTASKDEKIFGSLAETAWRNKVSATNAPRFVRVPIL